MYFFAGHVKAACKDFIVLADGLILVMVFAVRLLKN